MAKNPHPPSTCELLCMRIQQIINPPRAQSKRCAVTSRQPEWCSEARQHLQEELEHQLINPSNDCSVRRLRWNDEEAF